MPKTRSHLWIDQRSLALAEATALKLRRDPALFEVARQNLQRWRQTLRPWPADLAEWERILAEGETVALTVLVDGTARGRRLRQSSPFAGVLTPRERQAILDRYESIAA